MNLPLGDSDAAVIHFMIEASYFPAKDICICKSEYYVISAISYKIRIFLLCGHDFTKMTILVPYD